jgi:hypothetical protein
VFLFLRGSVDDGDLVLMRAGPLHAWDRCGLCACETLTSYPFILSGPPAPAITGTAKIERWGNFRLESGDSVGKLP